MQSDTPKLGPTYFPMDKVSPTGNDPTFLLNRQNATQSTTQLVSDQDRSANPATGDPSAGDKKKYTRLARIVAVIVIIASLVMFLAGVINIVVTVVTAKLLDNLKTNDNFKVLRSPELFIWFWITPGLWASIPPFTAALALLISRRTAKKLSADEYNPGLPIELQNSQKNYSVAPDVYRVFSIFSITFSLPVALLLALVDVLISINVGETIKVVLPIIVLLAAVVDFILLMVAWYKIKDAADSEYQYIGSTYTIYETYEPLLEKEAPAYVAPVQVVAANHQCCARDSPAPIVIINQPPTCQPVAPPVNVLVQEMDAPRPRPRPRPRPLPQPMAVPVPVPVPVVPRPVSLMPALRQQQRYYPNRMYGVSPSGFMGRPNAYQGMFLPPNGRP